VESNLLAHHLDVLERAGLIERIRSTGDRRRRYVRLRADAAAGVGVRARLEPQRALFVCSANSARSILAAALWRSIAGAPAESAGTEPAAAVHRGTIAAAERHRLDLGSNPQPRHLASVRRAPLVVTVCDRAHEEIGLEVEALHWSVPDPVSSRSRRSFDAVVAQLAERITWLVAA
jgi:ArsR family transcriptional regulator, arsenate/arsenite/antimonite-responsive transcriptional repressor / arsenate reductase (thioredoxin)